MSKILKSSVIAGMTMLLMSGSALAAHHQKNNTPKTSNNSHTVQYNDEYRDSVTFGGENHAPVSLDNVAGATWSEGSTTAANGDDIWHLSQTDEKIARHTAEYLGGGARIIVGNYSDSSAAPTFTIQKSDYHNVGDAFNAVDGNLTSINSKVDTLSVDSPVKRAEKGDVLVLTDGLKGRTAEAPGYAQRLKNVSAGTIGEHSLDAVNGSQLFQIQADATHGYKQMTGYLGGGAGYDGYLFTAPSYEIHSYGKSGKASSGQYNNVGDALATLDKGLQNVNGRTVDLENTVYTGLKRPTSPEKNNADLDAVADASKPVKAIPAKATEGGSPSDWKGNVPTYTNDGKREDNEYLDQGEGLSAVIGEGGALDSLNERINKTDARNYAYADKVGAETLDKANAYTDSRYNHLNSKMKKLRGRVDAGVAGATAIGSLSFDTLKANSISGGFGVGKNKIAGAMGYQRNFNDKWRARATIAVSEKYVQGGGSVGYSW